ncbi:hypothetical protein WAI453_003698 [Rhynchosporium graminicola]
MKFTIQSALFISSAFSAVINGAAIHDRAVEARDPDSTSCRCIGYMHNGNFVFAIVPNDNGHGNVRSGNAQVFNKDSYKIQGSQCSVSWTRSKYCKNWSTGLTVPTGPNCDGKAFTSVDCNPFS